MKNFDEVKMILEIKFTMNMYSLVLGHQYAIERTLRYLIKDHEFKIITKRFSLYPKLTMMLISLPLYLEKNTMMIHGIIY